MLLIMDANEDQIIHTLMNMEAHYLYTLQDNSSYMHAYMHVAAVHMMHSHLLHKHNTRTLILKGTLHMHAYLLFT